MKHLKLQMVFFILLICLAFASVAFAVKPLIDGAEKSIEVKQAVEEFNENLGVIHRVSEEKHEVIPYSNLYEAMQTYNLQLYLFKQNKLESKSAYEQPQFKLTDYGLPDEKFGVIKIPKMNLEMPLFLGASEANMAAGAAVLSQTSIPLGGENSNAVIAVFVILVVILLGVAISLFGRRSSASSYTPVSAEVEAYTPIITIYARQHGIPEYVELIKAVMMQESGGQGSDPMQCSESGYNTRYPHYPNAITDPEYSIEVGVQTLADVLHMAGAESPIDLDRVSLALQGYNYGPGYISWALANYGGYSEMNAIEFSNMMAAQYGWAGYGDKAYVSHVLRYYPLGRIFFGEGNQAIVEVAQSQIGNEGGLLYCEWYGYPYRVEWCAIFVSWCADQCGFLDAGVLPRMEGVRPYVDWFQERGQWQDWSYEPMAGDIIFLDWESDGLADHVGIVERVEGGVIYTVEGNADDRCIENHYFLDSAPVYGFGLPTY